MGIGAPLAVAPLFSLPRGASERAPNPPIFKTFLRRSSMPAGLVASLRRLLPASSATNSAVLKARQFLCEGLRLRIIFKTPLTALHFLEPVNLRRGRYRGLPRHRSGFSFSDHLV